MVVDADRVGVIGQVTPERRKGFHAHLYTPSDELAKIVVQRGLVDITQGVGPPLRLFHLSGIGRKQR